MAPSDASPRMGLRRRSRRSNPDSQRSFLGAFDARSQANLPTRS
jgi:hypothetical protein